MCVCGGVGRGCVGVGGGGGSEEFWQDMPLAASIKFATMTCVAIASEVLASLASLNVLNPWQESDKN